LHYSTFVISVKTRTQPWEDLESKTAIPEVTHAILLEEDFQKEIFRDEPIQFPL
jgi:hypothetical protein